MLMQKFWSAECLNVVGCLIRVSAGANYCILGITNDSEAKFSLWAPCEPQHFPFPGLVLPVCVWHSVCAVGLWRVTRGKFRQGDPVLPWDSAFTSQAAKSVFSPHPRGLQWVEKWGRVSAGALGHSHPHKFGIQESSLIFSMSSSLPTLLPVSSRDFLQDFGERRC